MYKRQCQYLDLQLDGADFQVGYKGIDDVPLFLGAAPDQTQDFLFLLCPGRLGSQQVLYAFKKIVL